jgi:branched-chain amino acid transport system substrate-binding protein
MPRNHRRLGFLVALLIPAGPAACGRDEPVAVGAALSTSFVDATRLAIAETSAGGRLPPLDTLMLVESTNRAALALGLADSLLARPGMVGMVGHSNSAASMAAAPVYNGGQVVQIAPSSTAVGYTQSGPFSFRMVPPDNEQGGFLAHVLDSLFPAGASVAVMYVNDDYGRGLREALLSRIDASRFRVVFQQPHTDEEYVNPPPDRAQRVGATVRSMLDTRPAVLLWLGRATTFRLYLDVLRELDRNLPVIGSDALTSWRGQVDQAGVWAGVRYSDFLDLDASEELRDFRRRYFTRFGVEAGAPEVLSYDAMNLLLHALMDGARTGDEVRQWLNSLGSPDREPYYGVSGRIAFDEHGDIARTYVLVTIRATAATEPP